MLAKVPTGDRSPRYRQGIGLGSFQANAPSMGDQRFAGSDVGVKMIFPNPLAPGKVVVVVAGVTWRGTLLSRYLPRFLPDVIVYDERIATRYMERLLIDRPVRMGAFFGSDWRL